MDRGNIADGPAARRRYENTVAEIAETRKKIYANEDALKAHRDAYPDPRAVAIAKRLQNIEMESLDKLEGEGPENTILTVVATAASSILVLVLFLWQSGILKKGGRESERELQEARREISETRREISDMIRKMKD